MSTLPNNSNEFSLPITPFHVALEEPMYFLLQVDDNRVRNVEVTAGRVFRGMEALATKRNFFQNIVLTERLCSLCSNSHPFTYCMALENLGNIAVPIRAQYLRVLAEEIKRISSHLFNVATLAHAVGHSSLFMHIMEVREIVQDIKETIYGNRMDLAANCIGGVKYDLDPELIVFLTTSIVKLTDEVDKVIEMYLTDHTMCSRTKGLGAISAEDVIKYGLVGPVARASGVAADVRKDAPYAIYGNLSFSVITRTTGDVHGRALVRLYEIKESIGIVKQIASNLPEGPLVARLNVIPPGQSVARSEAPRGELFYYLRTDESDIPTRLKWRVPSYMNWEALEVMLKDCLVSDVSVIVNSIDPCVSCTER